MPYFFNLKTKNSKEPAQKNRIKIVISWHKKNTDVR
jgi:hypothetical protein